MSLTTIIDQNERVNSLRRQKRRLSLDQRMTAEDRAKEYAFLAVEFKGLDCRVNAAECLELARYWGHKVLDDQPAEPSKFPGFVERLSCENGRHLAKVVREKMKETDE